MNVLIVVVTLVVAFVLLRMWDEAGRPDPEEEPTAAEADAPSAGARLAIVVGAIAVGFVINIGIPLALHAMEGGEDAGGDDVVERICAAADRPGAAAALRDICR